MRKIQPQEETGRVLAVTLLIWGVAVGAATIEGVFAKLSDGTFAALAVFAVLYAPVTYRIDRRLRDYVRARRLRHVAAAALALDAALVAAGAANVAWPMLVFFGLPLAIAANIALAERIPDVRSARPTSPGVPPAAT